VSDARLREAERRWRETGVVDDEAAWLVERLRVGTIRRLCLEWLMFLGDGASERALASERPTLPVPQRVFGQESAFDPRDRAAHRETTLWTQALLRDDRDAALRAMLALAERARVAQAPDDPLVRRAVAVAARHALGGSLEAHPQVSEGAWPITHALRFLRLPGDERILYQAFMTAVHALGRATAVEVARDALHGWWLEGRDVARELAES
jgi:hypothetical protein